MALDAEDLATLVAWRQARHRQPELSGAERQTADAVVQALAPLRPDQVLTGLGGHGVAAVFQGTQPGPTVMIRAELDALPIEELDGPAHRSEVPGVAHLCGHDGHSAILLGVARGLARARPAMGRAVLMFQPAEEDGSGAAAVMADPRFASIIPDWAFALHNMPGLPLGGVRVWSGPANCASVGMRIVLSGRTAHASAPETGLSPVPALLSLVPALQALGPGGDLLPGFRLVTITHLSAGAAAFGVSPGEGEVWATLRSLTDADMTDLRARAIALVQDAAKAMGLGLAIHWHDDFAACHNDPAAVDHIRRAVQHTATAQTPGDDPMRASEDFGRFARSGARSAMFLLGAGTASPALHNPDYDFPDALIAPGVALFLAILHGILSPPAP